jgi:hypothetical protein
MTTRRVYSILLGIDVVYHENNIAELRDLFNPPAPPFLHPKSHNTQYTYTEFQSQASHPCVSGSSCTGLDGVLTGFVQNLFPGVVWVMDPFLFLRARNSCNMGLPGVKVAGLRGCFGRFDRENELVEAGSERRLKISKSRDGAPEEFVSTRFMGLENLLRGTGFGDPSDIRSWLLELLALRSSPDDGRPRLFCTEAVGVEVLPSSVGVEMMELPKESSLFQGRTLLPPLLRPLKARTATFPPPEG